MRSPTDIQGRAEEIRTLIAGDRVKDAFKRLLDFALDFSDKENRNEAIVISSRSTRIERAELSGRLGFDEAEKERTRILYQALALIDVIEEHPNVVT